MKHIKLYFGMMVGLLAMLASCSDSIVNDLPSTAESDKGINATFNIAIPKYNENTTRSVTFGTNEGIENQNAMLLFCFDKEGQFVGLGKIEEFEPVKKDYVEGGASGTLHKGGDIADDGSTTEKKIKAQLPETTARIHFVANATEQYKTIDITNNGQDWVGMHENVLMTTFETQYGENQAQMTRYWGYVKKDSPEELKKFMTESTNDYIVHLVRDRAKISAKWAESANKSDAIKITVINGMAYGTLAPFNREKLEFPTTNGDKDWVWNIDYITSAISDKRLKGDQGQMMNPTYTFENRNMPNDPMKVIIGVDNRLYLVYLQDSKSIPYIIKRNYEYIIEIEQLDESLGYQNLEDALKSAPINNPWVNVKEVVPEISDGKYTLSIVGGTYKMLNEGSGEQTVQFTYSGDKLSAEDFYAMWTKNEQYATVDQPKITSFVYDESTQKGTGTISYTLNTIDNTLREGVIHLIDTKHGLNRDIHLYSITEFDYKIETPTSMSANENSEATLKFTVPDNVPEAFLPIEIKMASNDVNPKDCSVEVGDTKTDTGEDWNCWFVYTARTKGEHTITLKNLRNAESGATGSFYIKNSYYNQGKAKKFTFTYSK